MNWDDDARAAVAKAPFFVRGYITKRVEEHVRGQGRDAVTLADVTELRASVKKGDPPTPLRTGTTKREDDSEWGGMSAEEVERIARSSRPRIIADERTYEVKTCAGCPRAVFDVRTVGETMVQLIEEAGVPEAVVARVNGPVLKHHGLSVSISGCINSCSQPQIADFGVQGLARPVRGLGGCTGCGKCVRACQECAVKVNQKEPLIDLTRCIDCGDCARVCPTEALVFDETGFSVLVGGKLGRKPRLARTLFEFVDEKKLYAAFRVTCDAFANELEPKERLANAIDRIGLNEIARRC